MGYEYAIICPDENYLILMHKLFDNMKKKGSYQKIDCNEKGIMIEDPVDNGWIFLEIYESTALWNDYIMPDGFRHLYCYFSGGGEMRQYLDIIGETLKEHGGGCVLEEF